MTDLVIDASVAVKWYVEEEHTDHAEKLFETGFALHGPELIFAEFGNILWKKQRNSDVDAATCDAALAHFPTRSIEIHSIRKVLRAAYLGAVTTSQPIYDWFYLALAISLNCRFVTADRRFFLAMRRTSQRADVIWIENIPSLG